MDRSQGPIIDYKCTRCGRVLMTLRLADHIEDQDDRSILSGFFREHTDRGTQPYPRANPENVADIVANAPKSVAQKVDHLRLSLRRRANHLGSKFFCAPERIVKF